MNRKKRITTIIVAMAMFCMMSMSALASRMISLPENQVWTSRAAISRTGSFSFLYASCESVYPSRGSDNFTKIQARLVNSLGQLIMTEDYKILTEGKGSYILHIKEGHLDDKTVYIQFRGNTKEAAEAVVDYYSL